MEIRIKTHEEFKIDRMTIEIRGERDEIEPVADLNEHYAFKIEDLSGQLEQATQRAINLDAALAEAQSENDRLARDLEAQVSLNRDALSAARTSDNAAIQKDMKIAELERQIESALSRIETLEKKRKEERVRADQNFEWGERTEAKLADAIAKLGEIRGVTIRNSVADAISGDEDPADYSNFLATAVKDIRAILNREPSTIE